MARRLASYPAAIFWIAENDDTEWLDDGCGGMSVTACMVADLFDQTEEKVTKDIRDAVAIYLDNQAKGAS